MLVRRVFGSLSHSFSRTSGRSSITTDCFSSTTTHSAILPAIARNQLQPLSRRRAMASKAEKTSEWSAEKVRNTFLEYFKKHDHTFGNSTLL